MQLNARHRATQGLLARVVAVRAPYQHACTKRDPRKYLVIGHCVHVHRQRHESGCWRSARRCTRRHALNAIDAVPNSPPTLPPPSIQGVLFDLDGVLCSTQPLSSRIACQVLAELAGIELQPEELAPYRGSGEAALLSGAAAGRDKSLDVDRAVLRFLELYCRECAAGADVAYAGAEALVRSCRAAGLKVAVASSAAPVKVEASLAACGLSADDFDAIVAGEAVAQLKPAPDVFLEAAKRLRLSPEQCVVVEDSPVGIVAAAAAGMRCVAVATSGLPRDHLLAQGACLVRADIGSLTLQDLTMAGQAPTAAVLAAAPVDLPSQLAQSEGRPRQGQGVQGWLEQAVQLPAGYRTTRREVLKLLPMAGGMGCIYVALTRAKAMSLGSPQALLRALLPPEEAPAVAEGSDRVDAFVRYIADLERRGGGEEVPEFPRGLDWLNSPPLQLSKELRGKVVVLDFWTYCCINCMHVLPDLAALEAAFRGRPLAVVGVHSAKFDNEKDSEAIRNAVLRYDVEHPVVNDGGMALWGALGVSSWPTLLVVSPRGRVIARLAGEGHRQDLQDFTAAALRYYGPLGLLDGTPVPQALEKDKVAGAEGGASPLRYPGKLAVDVAGGRLFIADSNNHRVVITDLAGGYLGQVGGNGPGLRDGSWEEAAFARPQGVAYSARGSCLYVADTENHALRRVDLRQGRGRVETLVGNGVKGSDYKGGGRGGAQQLNSPWDVIMDAQEERVLVAMAGQHQIWEYVTATGRCSALSGTGYERNQNGPATTTSWAQPSGLSLGASGREVYVADSESSAVRVLDLQTGGSRLLAGGDPLFSENLFRFGDADGSGSSALLQHPLAVCAGPDGLVYIADSYNHKLKVLDTATGQLQTLAGDGRAGLKDGPLGPGGATRLSEPGGLAFGGEGKLYVADTNNGRVRVVDLKTRLISTLGLSGVPAPRVDPTLVDPSGAQSVVPPGAKVVRAPPAPLSSGVITIQLQLPDGYHLTAGANSSFAAAAVQLFGPSPPLASPPSITVLPSGGAIPDSMTFDVKFDAAEQEVGGGGQGEVGVRVVAKVYFCKEDDVCLFERICFLQPLTTGASEGGGAGKGARGGVLALGYRLDASAPVASPLG